MKKLLSIRAAACLVMTVLLLCSFAGCGSSSDNKESSGSASVASEASAQSESKTEDSKNSDNSKTLVVFFSATGNTRSVAEAIANETGAALFEVQPKQKYTDDDLNWNNDDSRVCVEHDNPDKRNVELVSTDVPNWDEFDTVYIGYPIWWGIAAWPINGFVQNNDFSNKTVIPFCTSSSSALGDSAQQLADLTNTGDWQDGKRFGSNADASEVSEWVKTIEK
ncbi:MAG: flavodoxin [Ruminococcus bromii]|nr:flavodoxin [Ruminococcus bromii]MCI7211261.1 flavodoxin [Ruminococcus bromii]MDD6434456.1 flavodoxin [Ruminococcus bromii]MDY4084340.1 flavodoxin [Ruminococcus bromii]